MDGEDTPIMKAGLASCDVNFYGSEYFRWWIAGWSSVCTSSMLGRSSAGLTLDLGVAPQMVSHRDEALRVDLWRRGAQRREHETADRD